MQSLNKTTSILFSMYFFLSSSLAFAKQPDITGWDDVKAKKGDIVSIQIQKNDCSQIWSKQIKEFKKKNPHIKDPNKIKIGEKLSIQSCKKVSQKNEEPVSIQKSHNDSEYESDSIHLNRFIAIYGGINSLNEDSGDSGKKGSQIGIKLGYELLLIDDKVISAAIGYSQHHMESNDSHGKSPEFAIDNKLINLELHYQKYLSRSWRLGGLLNLVSGKDVSFREKNSSQNVGLFGGVEALYSINKKWDIDVNIQQRIDELSRQHLMSNLGLKYNF